jgi:uncharacterized RDD family membrane protein YckC
LSAAIDTIITAETPEGIAISIRPAGFAVRCMAYLIDALIRFAIWFICASALGRGGLFGAGLMFVALFVLNWLYSVVFELSAGAATPGKRLMGLYVVMANGLPITPAGSLIRNLMRVADFLPLLYAFGIASMLLRRDCRRLGDLAAGTVVAYRDEFVPPGDLAEGQPLAPAIPLTARQQLAITAFAWRVERLTPERAEEIAGHAAGAAPAAGRLSLTSRLVGVARWLHGERPAPARTAAHWGIR